MSARNDRRAIRITRLVHWAARIWSVASVVVLLGFIFGEGIQAPTPAEWLGLLFFPLGIMIGMILGWWREGLGGAITIGSLAAFYLVQIVTAGTLPRGWAWLVFATPGFLYLLSWERSRTEGPRFPSDPGSRGSKPASEPTPAP